MMTLPLVTFSSILLDQTSHNNICLISIVQF